MKRSKPRSIENDNTPAVVAIGLIEIFTGALLCIIPHPITIGIGVGAITDGASRIIDAGVDLDQKNKIRVDGQLKYLDQLRSLLPLNNL